MKITDVNNIGNIKQLSHKDYLCLLGVLGLDDATRKHNLKLVE